MTSILLAAGVAIVLLAANVVMLMAVLHRNRQRKWPYRGAFSTANTSIRREATKVLEALHASAPDTRTPSHLQFPGHWLFAKVSDEHTGLLCGIAARPGPGPATHQEGGARARQEGRYTLGRDHASVAGGKTVRMAVKRSSDKEIVILDRRDSAIYAEVHHVDYHADKARELLADCEPDSIWETAYDGTVSAKDAHFDEDTETIINVVAMDMIELKGVRKTFEKVHVMTFGRDLPPPHTEDREKPVEVSVAEAELAHGVMVDWVWRLAARMSRRLNLPFQEMQDLRSAALRAFPEYAHALETAATEGGASNAKAVGSALHKLPNRVVRAMAKCMTDMEKNFAAIGVCECIEARVDKVRETAFDWSFQDRWETDDREPVHPAPAYARTLGSRSFRRKMEVVLGRDIALAVIFAYDDESTAKCGAVKRPSWFQRQFSCDVL